MPGVSPLWMPNPQISQSRRLPVEIPGDCFLDLSPVMYGPGTGNPNRNLSRPGNLAKKEDIPGLARDILCKLLCSLWGFLHRVGGDDAGVAVGGAGTAEDGDHGPVLVAGGALVDDIATVSVVV